MSSFHSRDLEEIFHFSTFESFVHARVELTDCDHDYEETRRHWILGCQTPIQRAPTYTKLQ